MSDAGPNHSPAASPPKEPEKKRKIVRLSDAWREASALVVAHRGRLSFGLLLMLFNRACAAVMPFLSKHVIDDVIGRNRPDLLAPALLALLCPVVLLILEVDQRAELLVGNDDDITALAPISSAWSALWNVRLAAECDNAGPAVAALYIDLDPVDEIGHNHLTL